MAAQRRGKPNKQHKGTAPDSMVGVFWLLPRKKIALNVWCCNLIREARIRVKSTMKELCAPPGETPTTASCLSGEVASAPSLPH